MAKSKPNLAAQLKVMPSLPPNSERAETATLGSILIDPRELSAVAAMLKPGDFFMLKHRWIFEAMLTLESRRIAIDNLTVVEELRNRNQLDLIGGSPYITGLINDTPTYYNAEYYAAIVLDKAIRRGLRDAATQIVNVAGDEKLETNDVIAKSEAALGAALERKLAANAVSAEDIAIELFNRLEAIQVHGARLGLSTGFPKLDDHLEGLDKGRMYIIGARPSVGKTALMLNIATSVVHYSRAHNGKPGKVLIVSLEMKYPQLATRVLSTQTSLPLSRLKTRNALDIAEWARVTEFTGQFGRWPIHVDDDARNPIPQRVRMQARRIKQEHGLALICVDYLQLMNTEPRIENKYQEVTEISRALKLLAMELEVPVLALAQLNRQSELRGDRRPQLSDLRDSGAIEQDADVVMLLHRPEKKAMDDLLSDAPWRSEPQIAGPVAMELIVAKQRDGKVGTIPMLFDGAIQLFKEA